MSPDDHRWPLLNLLADYLQRHPSESDMVQRYQDFVSENTDCFERSLLTGHVTGSALVLDSNRQRVLLTHHRKLNKWLQPGGHADGDSDVMNVGMREALEETGLAVIKPMTDKLLDVDIHLSPAHRDGPEHFHYDCRFLLGSGGSDTFTVSGESNDLAWVSMDRITDYTTDESILRMIEKAHELTPKIGKLGSVPI